MTKSQHSQKLTYRLYGERRMMMYNMTTVDLMPPKFQEKYGSRIVKQWETGERGTLAHTIWQEDEGGKNPSQGNY